MAPADGYNFPENVAHVMTLETYMNHIADHDLERYHLGMVTDEEELAALEEQYLGCPECAKRAEEAAVYVDSIRAAIITGDYDL